MNSIILKGNIATDIESRTTQSGIRCTTFRIAVTRPFVNKSSGQRETDFFNCVAWRGTGVDEKGFDVKTGKVLVEINPRYFRPAEVDLLWGDPSKAERVLGWKRKVDFKGLVRMMVRADMEKYGN